MSKPKRKPKAIGKRPRKVFAEHFDQWWYENHAPDLPEHQLNSARYMYYAGGRMLRMLMSRHVDDRSAIRAITAEMMEYQTGIPPTQKLLRAEWKKLEADLRESPVTDEQMRSCHTVFMLGAFTYFALCVLSDLDESSKVAVWKELDDYIPHDLRLN